jgi:DNA-binding response OmpR family regulator
MKFNAELLHCPDGASLFTFLRKIPFDEVCYILLDLNMPKLNGKEILKALSADKNWCMVPVIVFSSSSYSPDIATCYELGANAYVVKPLDLPEFDRVIQAIHAFWGDVNLRPTFE